MSTCADDHGQGRDPLPAMRWRRRAGAWAAKAAPFIGCARALVVLVRATLGHAMVRAGFAVVGLELPDRRPPIRAAGGRGRDGVALQRLAGGDRGAQVLPETPRGGAHPGPSSGHDRGRASGAASFVWPPVRPTMIADSVRYEVRALGLAGRGVRGRCTICGGPGPLVRTGGDGDGPQRRCEECLRAHLSRYTGPDGLDREVGRCLKRCRRGR